MNIITQNEREIDLTIDEINSICANVVLYDDDNQIDHMILLKEIDNLNYNGKDRKLRTHISEKCRQTGLKSLYRDRDWKTAEVKFYLAIHADPDNEILADVYIYLFLSGHLKSGLLGPLNPYKDFFGKAKTLDPEKTKEENVKKYYEALKRQTTDIELIRSLKSAPLGEIKLRWRVFGVCLLFFGLILIIPLIVECLRTGNWIWAVMLSPICLLFILLIYIEIGGNKKDNEEKIVKIPKWLFRK